MLPTMLLIAPVLLIMGVLFHLIPGLTRPDLFFAVTVPAPFRASPEGRAILRRYRTIIWASILLPLAAVWTTGMPLFAVIVPGAGFLWGFLSSRKRALAYAVAPDPILEVDLAAPEEKLPGGPIAALLPILGLIGLGIWAALHMDRLPARITVHWGLEGADGWVQTTPTALFGFLSVHVATCLLLVGFAWALLNWSRRISTSGQRAAGERQFRRRMMQFLIVIEYLMVIPPFFALLAPGTPGVTIWGAALTIVIVVFLVTLFRAGQGGALTAATAGGPPTGDRTPDACWKWGMIYFNPEDPSILVEKRFGIGYTVNFGNRWSWVVLGAVVVPAAVGAIFLR